MGFNRTSLHLGPEDVDVVRHAADFDGLHPVLPGDAAEIRPESFLESRRDQGPALLRAEDAMIIGADVRHAPHSAVPAGLMQRRMRVPNVETLSYCRQVPPGQVHAGLRLPLLNKGLAAAVPVRFVFLAAPDNHPVANATR